MKTYKNKKTGETMTYKDGLMMVDRCVIEGKPDSDFWEEVVEKDYEILSFQSKGEHKFVVEMKSGASKLFPRFKLKDYIANLEHSWSILSVKRLSDNKMFTVGDHIKETVTGECKGFTISEFSIKDTRCFTCGVNINNVEHIKKPLFVTEDGIDVFEGDTIEWVIRGKYEYSTKLCKGHVSLIGFKSNIYKVFSSKKLAIEYQDSLKIFTTEDGVDIFKGDFCWVVSKNYNRYPAVCTYVVDNENIFHRPDANYYFSTTNAASEFLKLNTKRLSIANVMDTIRDGNAGVYGHPGFGVPDYLIDNIQSALEKIKL